MKILHLDDNHSLLISELNKFGFLNDEDYLSTKEEVEKKIKNYQGLVIRSRFPIDKKFLDKTINFKFIARVGAGLENIDCKYAKEKGISLISAPEGSSCAVGEHAISMILSLFNKLNKADCDVRSGKWLRELNRGIELEGKTVGIIGYGNMGKSFAKKLKGFNVTTICYDIKSNVGDENCKQVSFDELTKKTDILSLHTPLTKKTIKMVDNKFINNFSKAFWLINTARGKSVVTQDLVNALKTKKILGAALDVLEYENSSFENLFQKNNILKKAKLPQAFEYLINSKNVILSPHIAGWTIESEKKLAQTIVRKIKQKYK